jgi:hypothetical protein
VQHRA